MPRPPSSPFRIEHAELTDQGMRRANNQDAVAWSDAPTDGALQPGHLFIVADGMGAHAAGELASKLAVDCLQHTYRKHRDDPPQAALRHAVREANTRINAKGQSAAEFQGMGTTCSSLVLLPEAALVAHVGDSRVYRLRGGQLEQLTFDHSLVWELAAASHTTADQVPACIPKNVITRSLGPHEQVSVDLEGPYTLAGGDVFVICSDGLTSVVEDELIGAVIGSMAPGDAGQTLIDLANLRGGPDNISVVVARVAAAEQPAGACSGSWVGPARPGRPSLKNVPARTWLALVGCVAAVVWFALAMQPLGALLASAGCGAILVVAMLQRGGQPPERAAAELGGPYGDGPYRTIDCNSGEAAAGAIASVVEELAGLRNRDPSEGYTPPIEDWQPFSQLHEEAKKAMSQGGAAEAVRLSGAAIRSLMDQVRASRTVEFR